MIALIGADIRQGRRMRDVLKELETYFETHGNDPDHNSITIVDVNRVSEAYKLEAVSGIAQLFCNIGYQRGYRDGQHDAKCN